MFLLSLFVQNLLFAVGNPQFHPANEFNVRNNEISQQMQLNSSAKDVCEPVLIKLSFDTLKFIAKPKGLCYYCCRVNFRNDVRFLVFTENNPKQGKLLSYTKTGRAAEAGLNPNIPTVVFIHGFLEAPLDGINGRGLLEAYFSRPEPYNFIFVDWSNLSAGPWYLEATQNTRVAAKLVAKFLRRYHLSGELPISTVHVIGFSLGTHIAGYAGKMLRELNLTIPRITALDVAGPGFSINSPEYRINKGDAGFIDIVHTDPNWLGFPASIGDVDFFVNANDTGVFQPGCSLVNLSDKNRLMDFFSCSHQRAVQYYTESVRNPDAFPATKCKRFKGSGKTCDFKTDAYMGFNVSREARGDYYLVTNGEPPFGMSAEQQS